MDHQGPHVHVVEVDVVVAQVVAHVREGEPHLGGDPTGGVPLPALELGGAHAGPVVVAADEARDVRVEGAEGQERLAELAVAHARRRQLLERAKVLPWHLALVDAAVPRHLDDPLLGAAGGAVVVDGPRVHGGDGLLPRLPEERIEGAVAVVRLDHGAEVAAGTAALVMVVDGGGGGGWQEEGDRQDGRRRR